MITFFFQLSNLSKSPFLKAFKALSKLALISGIETKRYPRCCLFTFLSTIRVDYNHESYIQTYGIPTAHLTKTASSIDALRISCCILSGRSLKSVDFQKFLNYFLNIVNISYLTVHFYIINKNIFIYIYIFIYLLKINCLAFKLRL